MVATMRVQFDFGGSDNSPGTKQNTSSLSPNLRFKTEDDATIDTANPLPVPSSGTTYSYWKQVYLYCSSAPSTQIDNIQLYSDGANGFGTGIDLWVATAFPVRGTGSYTGYDVADGSAGVSGNPMWYGANKHTDITYVASVFDYTSGSALGITISEAGSLIDAVAETSNYVVLQMEVLPTAGAGALSAETLTFQYDEI